MKRAIIFATILLPLTAAKSDPLAGRVAGKPVQCVDLSRLEGPDIVDDHTILYRQNAGRIWRTGPVGNCGPMRSLDTVIVDVDGGQICSNDRFRILAQGSIIPSPRCRFAPFVPYDKP